MRDVDVGVPPATRDTPVIINHHTPSLTDITLDSAWVAAACLALAMLSAGLDQLKLSWGTAT